MREYPIILTDRNVLAIMDGRKTQTRRIVKLKDNAGPQSDPLGLYFNRGQLIHPLSGPVRNPWGFVPPVLADSPEKLEGVPVRLWVKEWNVKKWKSPIFMPRWASRLLLDVVSVRAQRLQDISVEDAIAEGCSGSFMGDTHSWHGALQEFAMRWDKINAKRGSWKSNPWVWVCAFRRALEDR